MTAHVALLVAVAVIVVINAATIRQNRITRRMQRKNLAASRALAARLERLADQMEAR